MEKRANILIVDDNINLSKTMSLILGRKGYIVTTAKDGPEAIERVKESPFDIIFMDIKMPFMDGVETYREIKKIRPDAIVVMMTAYAVEELVAQALKEGAYGIIYKPLDIERVVSLIGRTREKKQGAMILVVDDDPGTCMTLEKILTKKNYQVGIAHDGEKAITMAKEKTYDIIFIDMKLPTLNGLEVFLKIKAIDPEVVAIIMTAYRQEMDDLVDAALNKRAYASIYKPFDIENLLSLTEGILEKKKRQEMRGGINETEKKNLNSR
jgi:DNA-binding NtrC family response regulator